MARNRRAVFRRGPDALSAAHARYLPRSAVFAAAALSSGDRPGAAGAGRPPAADRAGAGRGLRAVAPPGARQRRSQRPRAAAARAQLRRAARTVPRLSNSIARKKARHRARPSRNLQAPMLCAAHRRPSPRRRQRSGRMAPESLHAALMELGMPFTADAIENARVAESERRTASSSPPKPTRWR